MANDVTELFLTVDDFSAGTDEEGGAIGVVHRSEKDLVKPEWGTDW